LPITRKFPGKLKKINKLTARSLRSLKSAKSAKNNAKKVFFGPQGQQQLVFLRVLRGLRGSIFFQTVAR
jgi:hypothetical protein